jgi:hypothetical protein
MLAMVSRIPLDNGAYQERYRERATELFERLGDNFRLETTLTCGAFLRFSQGHFDGVRELTDRIHASGWPDGAPQTQTWGLSIRVCTDLLQRRPVAERIPQLEQVLDRGVKSAEQMLGRGVLALAYLVEGDPERSRAAAEEARCIVHEDPPTTSIASYGLWCAAWALLRLWEQGDESAARPAAEICRGLRKLCRPARVVLTPAHYFTGLQHALEGEVRKAARNWRATLAVDPLFATPYFTARACWELSRSDAVGEGERAQFAQRAREGFRGLDVPEDPFRSGG